MTGIPPGCWKAFYCTVLLLWPAAGGTVRAGDESAPPPLAGYDQGFFIRTPDILFELKPRALLQMRYTFESLEEKGDRSTESAFSIPRGRLILSGKAITEGLSFKFETEFGKGFVYLRDFFADYAILPKRLHVRAGQWKRPFSRQQVTSSPTLEMVDLALTDSYFGCGRDIGVGLHNGYEKSPPFEWALGIFNGTGDRPLLLGTVAVDPATGTGSVTSGYFSNIPERLHPILVFRAGYNHGGINGYSEADLEGGPLRFAIAASGILDLDADDDEKSAIRAELDSMIKVEGFSATSGLYVATVQDGDGFGHQAYAAFGGHIQIGYVLAQRFQPVLRYTAISPDRRKTAQEFAAGLSIYFFKHSLKWQTDFSVLTNGAVLRNESPPGDPNDYLVRTQFQLAF